MPQFDGTGPVRFGYGNGHGRCRRGINFRGVGRPNIRCRNRWLWGIALPVVVAAVRDLANPTVFLRQFTRTLLNNNDKQ
jgi:hypothetical protein